MMFSYRFYKIWQRNRDVFFKLWKTEVPGFFAEPLLVLVAMGIGLGAYFSGVEGQSYIQFIAPGIVAAYAMYSATFECTYGSFVRMEFQKTYEAIIATPVNVEDVVAGELFWGATQSLITASVILVIAAVFNLVGSWWALLILPFGFLEGLMFSSMAMVYTSKVPAIYTFNYYFTLWITPMFFFAGVFFPLSAFPEIVQRLSWIAPLTPVVEITRALMAGNLYWGLFTGLGVITALTALLFWLSLVLMKRRLLK